MSNSQEYCIFYCGFRSESQITVDEHMRDVHNVYMARNLTNLVDDSVQEWRLQGYDEFPCDYERNANVTYSTDDPMAFIEHEKATYYEDDDEPYERVTKRPRLEEV